MTEAALTSADGVRALLERAEDQLSKNEFALAERFARKALASPLLTPTQKGVLPQAEVRGDVALAHCILGACCSATGRTEEALAHFQKSISFAESISNKSLQARALNGMAVARRDNREEAIQTANRARSLAEEVSDNKQLAKALNILGSLHTDSGDYSTALDYYTHAVAVAEEMADHPTMAACLGNLGNVQRLRGEYRKALEAFTVALTLSEHAANNPFRLRILHQAGEAYSALADYQKALDFFRDARAIATELNSRYELSNLDISTGIVYSCLADYAHALDLFDRALKFAEEVEDQFGVATCLDNIGTVYWNLTDYPRALDYYSRALAISEEIGATSLIANELGNCGIAYNDLGDHQRALDYLLRAERMSKTTGDRSQSAHWMYGIAVAHQKLGNTEAALHEFLEALRFRREELQTNDGVAETLIAIGTLLRERGQPADALPYLVEAQKLAGQLDEKKFEAESHRELATTYSMLENAKLAFEHHLRFHAIDKGIFSEESQKRIELFHIRVAVAEKELQTEMHRLRADRSEHDLANSIMQLLEQSELLANIRDELTQITRKMSASGDQRNQAWEPSLRELKEKLNELPSRSVDWTKLEMQFAHVHPNFKSALLAKYPTLTKQELKMCILARLGIKTVDIARLLHLSERTIDSHRLSLRKKIGLKKDQTLTAFLTAIAPS